MQLYELSRAVAAAPVRKRARVSRAAACFLTFLLSLAAFLWTDGQLNGMPAGAPPASERPTTVLLLKNGNAVWADVLLDDGKRLTTAWRGGLVTFSKSEISAIITEGPIEPDEAYGRAGGPRSPRFNGSLARGMSKIGAAFAAAVSRCAEALRPYGEFFGYLRPLVT